MTQNLSYTEAKAKFLSSQPKPNLSYAAVVTNKPKKSIGIQCDVNEIEPNNNLKALPRQESNASKVPSQPPAQTQKSEISIIPSTSSQITSESQKYLKLTPQLITKLQQKLTQSPLVSKQKYVPKSRQNKFHKIRVKQSKNKEQQSQSDAMSTDDDNAIEIQNLQMQTEVGMETPPNLYPKNTKHKIRNK